YPAHVRATADAGHGASLGDVALHDWTPAAELDDALGRAVVLRKISLFVVAAAVAAFVHGGVEQPFGAPLGVERDHWCASGELIQKIEQGLHEVVGLHRTTGHVHDRDPRVRLPITTEVVAKAHRAGGVARHGVNPTIGRAGADRDHRPRAR